MRNCHDGEVGIGLDKHVGEVGIGLDSKDSSHDEVSVRAGQSYGDGMAGSVVTDGVRSELGSRTGPVRS